MDLPSIMFVYMASSFPLPYHKGERQWKPCGAYTLRESKKMSTSFYIYCTLSSERSHGDVEYLDYQSLCALVFGSYPQIHDWFLVIMILEAVGCWLWIQNVLTDFQTYISSFNKNFSNILRKTNFAQNAMYWTSLIPTLSVNSHTVTWHLLTAKKAILGQWPPVC